jgi:hypothetical protein
MNNQNDALKQAQKSINKLVIYPIDGMSVTCKITDVKSVYGRILYKLIPMCGSGHKWTNKELEEIND